MRFVQSRSNLPKAGLRDSWSEDQNGDPVYDPIFLLQSIYFTYPKFRQTVPIRTSKKLASPAKVKNAVNNLVNNFFRMRPIELD
jgi:hypothetical protein